MPADREHQQDVVLAAVNLHAVQVIVGQRDRHQTADQEERLQEDGKSIHDDHAVEGNVLRLPRFNQEQDQRYHYTQGRQDGSQPFAMARDEQIHQDQKGRPQHQDGEGQDGERALEYVLKGHDRPLGN